MTDTKSTPAAEDQAAKHTPGPWEHGDNGLIYGQVTSDEENEAPFVCDVISDEVLRSLGILSPVEKANARLIAAAPELLKALNDLLFTIRVTAIKHASQLPDLERDAQKAHAAIAKAEGR